MQGAFIFHFSGLHLLNRLQMKKFIVHKVRRYTSNQIEWLFDLKLNWIGPITIISIQTFQFTIDPIEQWGQIFSLFSSHEEIFSQFKKTFFCDAKEKTQKLNKISSEFVTFIEFLMTIRNLNFKSQLSF